MEKEEIDGMILAQNKEQYKGYTVFHIPFTGGTIVKMMTLKDVQAIVEQDDVEQDDLQERIRHAEDI